MSSTNKSLLSHNAIVTGEPRDISDGIVLELAKRDTNVLITYNSAGTQESEVISNLKAGHVDIIINNAGAGHDCLLQDDPRNMGLEETIERHHAAAPSCCGRM
ncbi:hypothetical protein N7495_001632 [Penicillium taxi]|uniref:uncharacterized protein n=1 Tax=Penicillium taxi TaxID=168475 RepID=UPI0025451556|nr:uncharacterized protein N7495_001632 [Penicillium taxi]KAJ5908950.1 hypothetical protein N7495_001632 [Penicillium taxi]